jgi:hypothetical protein
MIYLRITYFFCPSFFFLFPRSASSLPGSSVHLITYLHFIFLLVYLFFTCLCISQRWYLQGLGLTQLVFLRPFPRRHHLGHCVLVLEVALVVSRHELLAPLVEERRARRIVSLETCAVGFWFNFFVFWFRSGRGVVGLETCAPHPALQTCVVCALV